MTWQPLVTDPALRERIVAAIADVARALEPNDQIEDLLDLAVLRAYVADLVPDEDDISGNALSRAVTLFPACSAAMALASRRRATASNAGPMSAIFFTRSRMPAKSALASMPQGRWM